MSERERLRQAQRLMRCAKAVKESPEPKAFTMRCFLRGDKWELWSHDEVHQKHWCGTPACVLGHYASRPDLQRVFKVVKQKLNAEDRNGNVSLSFLGHHFSLNDVHFEKVQRYFGLDYDGIQELFGPSGCGGAETPKQAAAYITNFVRDKYGFVPKV